MNFRSWLKICPLLAMAFAVPAQAALVVASGAGPLPGTAEDLTGTYVTEIVGSIADPLGVNMFAITIMSPVDFSAITVDAGAFGIPDTELFLFDSGGNGVYFNDDIDGSNTLSCLPSGDAGNPCESPLPVGVGPTTPGLYYLAITRSANQAQTGGNYIFNTGSSTDVLGPALAGGVDAWDNGVYTSPDFDLVNYDILLTGTTPEPATWTMIATAGLALAWLRRRKVAARR